MFEKVGYERKKNEEAEEKRQEIDFALRSV